jgi:Protein of unknown function (DUF2855)
MTDNRWTIAIDRDDIRSASVVPLPPIPLSDGQIEVAITSYAMTANNITYAALGKPMGLFGNHQGYWDFFSAPDGPGHLPVWGFATVTASKADGISVGEEYYGYFPMASHAVLTVAKASPRGFIDATPHRTTLPSIYNQYQSVSALADYRAEHGDMWPIFRVLFLTGWMIADQLEDEGDYGAAQILIASASSKTAICLGFAQARRSGARAQTVGLTSFTSVAGLAQRGVYDAVMGYDDISALDPAVPSVLVDMAGNGAVTAAVHQHFGDALKASIIVGKSHWDASANQAALPGPQRQSFFAPGRAQKRIADWGGAEFGRRMAEAWRAFMDIAPTLAVPDRRHGSAEALTAYQEMLGGKADPAKGLLVIP